MSLTERALRQLLHLNVEGCYRYGVEADHRLAETLLLRLYRKRSLAKLWDEASDQWWYA